MEIAVFCEDKKRLFKNKKLNIKFKYQVKNQLNAGYHY